MTFEDYLKTEAGQKLVSEIDDHSLFYLNAFYEKYLVVDDSAGCHQPEHGKHKGVRIKQYNHSKGVICIECDVNLMKKTSSSLPSR